MSLDKKWSLVEGVIPDFVSPNGTPGTPGNPLRGFIVTALTASWLGATGSAIAGAVTNVAIAAGSVAYSSQRAKKQQQAAQSSARAAQNQAQQQAAAAERAAAKAAQASARRVAELQKQSRFQVFSQPVEQVVSSLTTTVTDPVAARRIVYGRTRIGGVRIYSHTHNDDEKLIMVLVLGDGPFDGLESVYFDDTEIDLTDDAGSWNNATNKWNVEAGKYDGRARVWFHDGAAGQLANTHVTTNAAAWTSDCTLSGIAYLVVELDYDIDVFDNGIPNVSAVVRGRSDVYDPRTDSTGWTENVALCYSHYLKLEWGGLDVTTGDVDDVLERSP